MRTLTVLATNTNTANTANTAAANTNKKLEATRKRLETASKHRL